MSMFIVFLYLLSVFVQSYASEDNITPLSREILVELECNGNVFATTTQMLRANKKSISISFRGTTCGFASQELYKRVRMLSDAAGFYNREFVVLDDYTDPLFTANTQHLVDDIFMLKVGAAFYNQTPEQQDFILGHELHHPYFQATRGWNMNTYDRGFSCMKYGAMVGVGGLLVHLFDPIRNFMSSTVGIKPAHISFGAFVIAGIGYGLACIHAHRRKTEELGCDRLSVEKCHIQTDAKIRTADAAIAYFKAHQEELPWYYYICKLNWYPSMSERIAQLQRIGET
jgi:hypothetical protein